MQELISQKELDIKVKTLAKQITNEHRGEGTPVVFIGLLNGCFMFYSDLIKNIKLDVECDFMRVKSYIGKKKQGDIQITKDLEIPIKGKHVYLVDDIYDTTIYMSKKRYDVETAQAGFANGISTQLAEKFKHHRSNSVLLTDKEKYEIIENAAVHFGKFLTALGVDWKNDPNSEDTPTRVAKAYVYDLFAGRFNPMPEVTAFPSDGYTGIVQESNIPLTSMCSHHHQTIQGTVSIAYVPSKDGKVVGLSKLNRIVEHFGRRGAIQEQLTVAIHNAVDTICEGNVGVAVIEFYKNIELSKSCK